MTGNVEDIDSRQVAYMEVSRIVPRGSSTSELYDRYGKPVVWTLSFFFIGVCSFASLSPFDWLTDLQNY